MKDRFFWGGGGDHIYIYIQFFLLSYPHNISSYHTIYWSLLLSRLLYFYILLNHTDGMIITFTSLQILDPIYINF